MGGEPGETGETSQTGQTGQNGHGACTSPEEIVETSASAKTAPDDGDDGNDVVDEPSPEKRETRFQTANPTFRSLEKGKKSSSRLTLKDLGKITLGALKLTQGKFVRQAATSRRKLPSL